MIDEKFKKLFEDNCIIEKDGKKFLNEFGSIVICFLAVSLAKYLVKELGLKEFNKNE